MKSEKWRAGDRKIGRLGALINDNFILKKSAIRN
jgi:hypothetical protein